MSDRVNKRAHNLDPFKLSEFVENERNLIIKMRYDDHIVNWKTLNQCYVLFFTNDNSLVDWDNLSNNILEVMRSRQEDEIQNKARQTIYDLHAITSKVVAAKIISPFEEDKITDRGFVIRAYIDEHRAGAQYFSEIHLQDLLYYGIVDLVKNGKYETKVVLKKDYHELVAYMDSIVHGFGIAVNEFEKVTVLDF